MEKLTKGKVVLHCFALFFIMFIGDFLGSIPWDIIFGFITLPYVWMYGFFRILSSIVLTLYLFYQYAKRILHRDMSFFRVTIPKVKLVDVALSILLPGIVILSYITLGKSSISEDLTVTAVVSILMPALVRALKAGILEEVLFRAFILKLVETKWNKYVAIFVPSFIFSLVHIPSMKTFSYMGLLLLLISGTSVGVMFSLMTYKNNSIWGSVLLHSIWNFSMINHVFYFAADKNSDAIVSLSLSSKNVLLTGGDFGVESSIFAIVAYSLIIVIILWLDKCKSQKV